MTVFKGNGVIWDGSKKKNLCKFVDGKFETKDQRTIDILKNFDGVELISEDTPVKVESIAVEIEEEPAEEPKEEKKTKKALIAEAKELGIKGADRMTADKLTELLEG